MRKITSKRQLFPPWKMPSDPVKAIWWFMHWLLKVLVRYFWFPIVIAVTYEVIVNARLDTIAYTLVAGLITLLIGLCIWAVLYVVLRFIDVVLNVGRVFSDVSQMQRDAFDGTFSSSNRRATASEKVVEGSITEVPEEEQQQEQ